MPVNISSIICVNIMECNVALSTSVEGIVFSSIRSCIKPRITRFSPCVIHLSESHRVMMFLQGMTVRNDNEKGNITTFYSQQER